MFKKLGLSGLVLATALSVFGTSTMQAREREREHHRHRVSVIVGLHHRHYADGYYDRWGYWHPTRPGYYDRHGMWRAY